MRVLLKMVLGLALLPAPFAFADWTDQISQSQNRLPQPLAKPEILPDRKKEPPKTSQPSSAAPKSVEKPIETPRLASRLKACPALVSGLVEGKYLPPVRTETLCGDEAPLLVTSVEGVTLKPAAQMNCAMTMATAQWVARAKVLARDTLGSELNRVLTSSSYVCRRRNNRPDGKFSEHATMNALDVSGFTFKSGKTLMLLGNWQKADVPKEEKKPEGTFLRQVHGAGCTVFTTTLGPEANAAHENHFHFDMGCHGKRCTYRLCE